MTFTRSSLRLTEAVFYYRRQTFKKFLGKNPVRIHYYLQKPVDGNLEKSNDFNLWQLSTLTTIIKSIVKFAIINKWHHIYVIFRTKVTLCAIYYSNNKDEDNFTLFYCNRRQKVKHNYNFFFFPNPRFLLLFSQFFIFIFFI